MSLSFNDLVGHHEAALYLRGIRGELIANNIANADTPNFQARDIDFADVMQRVLGEGDKGLDLERTASVQINSTHSVHEQMDDLMDNELLKYRIPLSPSQDGNTVEASVEYMNFTDNAINYEAVLDFLGEKFTTLAQAIKGDNI